jgi:hypothetical protein
MIPSFLVEPLMVVTVVLILIVAVGYLIKQALS